MKNVVNPYLSKNKFSEIPVCQINNKERNHKQQQLQLSNHQITRQCIGITLLIQNPFSDNANPSQGDPVLVNGKFCLNTQRFVIQSKHIEVKKLSRPPGAP